MKSLRNRLLEKRNQSGLAWEVIERDYLLSWILAGISQVKILQDTLVFKGGTALKKCYFGNYRFSEDLDFTGVEGVPTGIDMTDAMQKACAQAVKLLDVYAPMEIICERHVERNPHPRGQESFDIHGRFPWHRQPQTHIMVEITIDEQLVTPTVERPVIHEYEESLDAKLQVYSLEEIIAEKLRAILQNLQLLERKGWVRSRARDYYDLWRIFNTYKNQLKLSEIPALLQKKCQVRNVTYTNGENFFTTHLLSLVEKTWEQWLGPLLPELPAYKTVIEDLKRQIPPLLIVET